MSSLSPETLRPGSWFKGPKPPTPEGPGAVVAKTLVGLAVAGFMFSQKWWVMGSVVAGVAVLVGGASLASPGARRAIDGFFVRLGRGLGRAASWLLLTPVFFLVFPVLRLKRHLAGEDPLGLEPSDDISFWHRRPSPERTTRWRSTSFVPERLSRRGLSWITVLLVGFGLLGVAEGTLRVMGFGEPVLYVDDERFGYAPAPEQHLEREGNRVQTNNLGMRAPDVGPKAAGTLRILMLGDSTLYGGSYVDQDGLYARRLAKRLGEAADKPVEILNMGVNGWGPFHALGWVQVHGALDADLAVITLPIDDLRRPLSRLSMMPYLAASNPPTFALEEVAAHLMWRWRKRQIGPPDADTKARRYADGIAAYVALAKALEGRGATVLFAVLPGLAAARGKGDARQVWIDKLAAAVGSRPFDYPAQGFQAQGVDPEPLYHDSVHLSPAGHEAYAEHLHQWLTGTAAWRAAVGGGR